MSLMRSVGDITRPQVVLTWSKAQVGAVTGTADAPAAHCLPCQLWIENTKSWDLVHSTLVDRDKLAKILKEDIFGHETILPLPFNLADSLSEKNCLRGALVSACEYVIAHTKPSQRQSGVLKRSGDGTILPTVEDRPDAAGIDHQPVRDGYGIWQKQAAAAFAAAKEEAREGVRYKETDYTADVLYILEKYEQSLSKLPRGQLLVTHLRRVHSSLCLRLCSRVGQALSPVSPETSSRVRGFIKKFCEQDLNFNFDRLPAASILTEQRVAAPIFPSLARMQFPP